jgi:hypothetical protein
MTERGERRYAVRKCAYFIYKGREHIQLVNIVIIVLYLYITLHYIALHFLDPELVKMTLGCGMCNVNAKHMSSTAEEYKLLHIRLFKDTAFK